MTLPVDLCKYLHEFTRPVFPYFQEINDYKRFHRIPAAHKVEALKEKLMGEDAEKVLAYLRDYLGAEQQLVMANEDYAAHMARSRRDLTVAELLEYRVIERELHEDTCYASWLTCWYHHELQAEVIGRNIIWYKFPPFKCSPQTGNWTRTLGGWVFHQNDAWDYDEE